MNEKEEVIMMCVVLACTVQVGAAFCLVLFRYEARRIKANGFKLDLTNGLFF
jgi:hypothetical protein